MGSDISRRRDRIGDGLPARLTTEQGPWSVWRGPHAHTPSYLAAGVPVVAGADPHDGQRAAYRAEVGHRIGLQPTTARCWSGSDRTSLSICTTAKPRARLLLDAVEIGASRGSEGDLGREADGALAGGGRPHD